MKGIKFVTNKPGPNIEEVKVTLEEHSSGVTLEVDGYYVCTLKNNGVLRLNKSVNTSRVETDAHGVVKVERE